MHGGIAAYADQAVTRLRDDGHEVVVASPEPSSGESVLNVSRAGAGARLARLAAGVDQLVVQFYPDMLSPPGAPMAVRGRSLLRLARGLRAAPSSELVVHEVNYGEGPAAPILRRIVRAVWKLADVITVHTERERTNFTTAFGIDPGRVRVVSQGQHLVAHTVLNRTAARAALGLPSNGVILVALGFLHPHKGFDRAVDAFRAVADPEARLYVVGSVWREDGDIRRHVEDLKRRSRDTPGVELRETYLSDEEFDRWIVAADALVLPYREGWSSNVMERGLLYDRPVIMSRVGGMAEQGIGRSSVRLVEDDAALVNAVREAIAELDDSSS
jgi:glycosyltransferase involved in cell wall biosynthesis